MIMRNYIHLSIHVVSLQWRHNGYDGVWDHQPHDWLLNRLFRRIDQRKHLRHWWKSSASLAFVRGINRWPVNSPHKGPVTRKMLPFDDVIMLPGFGTESTLRSRILWEYYQTSNISGTKSQNYNVSRIVLQLSLPSPLKPGVKSRMKL